jgi:hypothetical protein
MNEDIAKALKLIEQLELLAIEAYERGYTAGHKKASEDIIK